MTFYVDELRAYGMDTISPAARLFGVWWCHLTTDGSEEELCTFAESLGLKRQWIQHKGRLTVHFDLTPNKRELAIRLGAKETTTVEAYEMAIARRKQHEHATDTAR